MRVDARALVQSQRNATNYRYCILIGRHYSNSGSNPIWSSPDQLAHTRKFSFVLVGCRAFHLADSSAPLHKLCVYVGWGKEKGRGGCIGVVGVSLAHSWVDPDF